MRSASLYRVSGNSLMYAALLLAIGTVLLPRGPVTSIATASARVGPAWVIAHALMVVGGVLGLMAIVGFYRNLADDEHEGWALAFLATGAVGMVLTVLLATVSGVSEAMYVRWVRALPPPAGVEPAQAALTAVIGGLYLVENTVTWLCLVPLALVMRPDALWPRWLVWGALACGVIEAAGPLVLAGHPTLTRLLTLLGFRYLVLLGGASANRGRAPRPQAAPVQPGVGARL